MRVLGSMPFASGPKTGIFREISPRKVRCWYCQTTIMGNDEERIRISYHSGIRGDLGDKFWKRWKTFYMHAQCMAAFAMPEIPYVEKGHLGYSSCASCHRFGKFKLCDDGNHRCQWCMPYYLDVIDQAIAVSKKLDRIASSDS